MDAGTLQATPDALDDQIAKDAAGFANAVGTGGWVAAALFGAALVAGLVKKFGIGMKKVEVPAPVKPNPDADKAADEARALLSMKEKSDE